MIGRDNNERLVRESCRLAEFLLHDAFPERWHHTRGVAERASRLVRTVPGGDRGILVAVAWLHDIGYGRVIRVTGFHPIDGGLHLRRSGWDARIAALVAHHSGARFEAESMGGLGPLLRSFEIEDSAVSDALTYADQTVGPWGREMTMHDRIDEAIARHGPRSPLAQASVERLPYLRSVADRVERRLLSID